MFFDSFKTLQDLTNNLWLPNPWTLQNYQEIIARANFAQALLNSVIVALPPRRPGADPVGGPGLHLLRVPFPGP